MIPSWDTDNQTFLQSDWARVTTGHTQRRVVVSNSSFHFTWCKNVRYWLIPSKNIDDERILQSDWMRGTTGHIRPKVVISNLSFCLWLSPCKKSKVSIEYFQRYWWSKNTAIWLVGSVLHHNWTTKFFPNMQFCRIIKNIVVYHF